MSDSGFLGRLLDGADVEWKPLKKVLRRTKGTKITAGQMKRLHREGAPLKVFAGGKTVAFVNFDDIPQKNINTKPSIIVKSRGIIAFEFYDRPFSHKNEMWSYHSNVEYIDIKYVYHFLKMNERYFQAIGSKMQMPQISTPVTDDFTIPIPCPENPKKSLAIQAEIVRILDTFAELTAELTAELKARQKQYNHYRDELLTFTADEVEWLPLGDVILPTQNIKWQDTEHTFQYIDLTSVSVETNTITETLEINSQNAPSRAQKLVENDDVIFATTRPTQQRYCLVGEKYSGGVVSTGYCVLRAKKEKVLPKWILHWVSSTKFKNYVESQQTGAAYPAISDSKVKAFQIPIPCPENPEKSLAEQARIVAILDKFDALTHSIQEGLPREIELRQKQYEYYRDQLLNFPGPKDDA